MLNRRHLRIKVLQSLYAYFQSADSDYLKSEKEMMNAIDRIYDLYLYLILSFAEVKVHAERKIEEGKNKMRPSDEELSPNLKLVDNKIISILENSTELRKIAEGAKINWVGDEHQEMFRKMMNHIKESETYFEYMNNGEQGFEEDRAFAIELFKEEIANFSGIYSFFEEKSIHWLDDIDLACNMVVKTIKNFSEEGENEILPLYKDKKDEQEFVKMLLKGTIEKNLESEKLIDELTSNWELDRIAKMDVILMKMAIAELQIFTNIPAKVTLNEYIEISKFYSTPKSNGFINGILDQAIGRLEKEGKMSKIGRGLKN